ncbi:MAG: alpha/beta hydrolase, partial [Pontibacter sp.]|nr:alpha/beta hydrolase [Pontibacter sp.]
NATYKGVMQDTTTLLGGLAQNSSKAFPLNMKKVDRLPVAKASRPQEPVKPYPYLEEDVQYRNEQAKVTLSGTLTIPNTAGPHPAVLLIPGSGPNDRDQTIMGHKVFLVLADLLTRSGYAVLRVDDRGVNKSTGDFETASIADLASDAEAGVRFLKVRPEIDKARIGLVGHSLGAEIAPIAANKSEDGAFVVLMAGAATTSMHVSLYEQTRAHYASLGVSETGIEVNNKILKAVFEAIRTEKDNEKALAKIAAKFKKLDVEVAKLSSEERKLLELSTPLNPKQFTEFLSPAYRVDLFHNLAAELEKVKCPVLAINGSKDLQVLPINLQRIEKALQKGGNRHYTVKEFENKNHLFQTTATGAIAEYSELEETFAPDVVEYMVNWMNSLDPPQSRK